MKPLIVANWKCNPTTLAGTRELLNGIKKKIKDPGLKEVDIVICPPFIYLPYWIEFFSKKQTQINLGAQNLFWEESGAFTGEISPAMLKNLGCRYVIIGHSERRKYFAETDEMINKKIKAALKLKLKPILCIGETEKQRKSGKTFQILKAQLDKALKGILNSRFYFPDSLVVAYEPVWAIGTGIPCRPEDAKKVLIFIKKFLKKSPILYGGSVNSENAASYVKKAGFDGLLVGGASLDSKEFIKIIKNVNQ